MRMRKLSGLWLLGGLALILFGCTSSDHEMAGGNIQAINHTVHAINWLSVNGYRAHGGGVVRAALLCQPNGALT